MKRIFLSYSRKDNEPFVKGEDGWVTDLRRKLEIELPKDGDHETWMDVREIRSFERFDNVIETALDEADVLLVVSSPHWHSSNWCAKELKHFVNKYSDGGLDRIVVVQRRWVESAEYRACFDGTNGIRFHIEDFADKLPQDMLRELDPKIDLDDYKTQLLSLSRDLKASVQNLRNAETAPKIQGHSTDKRILVARPSPDLLSEGERFVRELHAMGYKVLEPRQYRDNWEEFHQEWIQLFKEADASVHFVGEDSDPMFCDVNRLLVEEQFIACSDLKEKMRLTWIKPSALQPSSENHKTAMRIRDAEKQVGDRLFETVSVTDAIAEITEILQRKKIATDRSSIYLVFSKEDQEKVKENVWDWLRDNSECVVETSLLDHDGSPEIESEHIIKLGSSAGVLLYWGSASDDWFTTNAGKLVKYAGINPDGSLRVGCLASPISANKQMKAHTKPKIFDMVLEGDDNFADGLRAFVTMLEGVS